MSLLKKINDTLTAIIRVTSIVFYTVMLIAASLQIVMRFVFKAPLAWTDEVAKYTFVWGTMLGCAYHIRTQGHSKVTVLQSSLKKKNPAIANGMKVLVDVLGIVFFAVVFAGGISLTLAGLNTRTPALDFPMYIIYLIMPISGLMMVLFQIEVLVKDLKERRG